MTQDRRLHYRVSPNAEREVVITVITDDGLAHRVAVIDISAGGVALAVDAKMSLPVAESELITIRFESKKIGSILDIPSQIRHIKTLDDQKVVVYGVGFVNWSTHRNDLTPKLRALFNEREAVRVDPQDNQEIEVELVLSGTGSIVTGLLRDVSMLGIGVWVSSFEETPPMPGDDVTLSLTLPNHETPMQILATVQYRQPAGDQTRIGLKIGASSIQPTTTHEKTLTSYVMARQLETARLDNERRQALLAHYPAR